MKRTLEQTNVDPTEHDSELELRIKWGRSTYPVELTSQSTVADLKNLLFQLTEVLPKRQKVLGLPRIQGRVPDDSQVLSSLSLRPDQQLMLIGSREADISALNAAQSELHNVINDLDFDYDPEENPEHVALRMKAANRRRLERRIQSTEFRIINPPRDGKKLLVLDLDYTLFDCRGTSTNFLDLARPGLHQFLASVYRYYDIVVWSQTSWRWLEAKLTELSMLSSENYKLTFVLDRTSMFQINSRRGGHDVAHEVKALEIIWRKFPDRWNPSNTIHIDDLSRNFALNPQSGLKISAFKNSEISRLVDRELFMLDTYLTAIAERESDFTKLKHKQWKRYCRVYIRDSTQQDQ
eukprot:GFKZ01001379.1.p1 GENE.GFKZ01001379.1~~GFKZ01001379.1.p1  ORF type:complete len:351 (-),score=46.94 GFKZ01001379.1:595-1647(-)